MIVFLEGTVVDKQPTRIVMSVNGVGYEVWVPLSTFDRLPPPGQACRVLTYDHVREDDHQLFGFVSEAERQMFMMLMSVSGIGPKLALTTLSGLSLRDLKQAIAAGDIKRLSSVSGIGRKTAERMVVDLRDKLGQADALEAAAAEPATPEDRRARDVILALVALGYKRAEAEKKFREVLSQGGTEGAGVEDLVRRALGS